MSGNRVDSGKLKISSAKRNRSNLSIFTTLQRLQNRRSLMLKRKYLLGRAPRISLDFQNLFENHAGNHIQSRKYVQTNQDWNRASVCLFSFKLFFPDSIAVYIKMIIIN